MNDLHPSHGGPSGPDLFPDFPSVATCIWLGALGERVAQDVLDLDPERLAPLGWADDAELCHWASDHSVSIEEIGRGLRFYLGHEIPLEGATEEERLAELARVMLAAPERERVFFCLLAGRRIHRLRLETPQADARRGARWVGGWMGGIRSILPDPVDYRPHRDELERQIRVARVEEMLGIRLVRDAQLAVATMKVLVKVPAEVARQVVSQKNPLVNTTTEIRTRLQKRGYDV